MEKIFIKNRDGLNIAIRLSVDSKNDKLVFLMHGLGARKEYPHMLVMEEVFFQDGYNVVNIDMLDSLNESDSSEKGITLTGCYENLIDVIQWAKQQNFYTYPFALAGQSLGACACVLYASNYPQEVNLLVTAAFPWLNGLEHPLHMSMAEKIKEKGYFDKVSKSTGRTLRIKSHYIEDMKQYMFEDFVKNIIADTYLIIGTADSEYHIGNNKKLYDLLTCKKELIILDGVPHDLANTPETKEKFTNALKNIFINK